MDGEIIIQIMIFVTLGLRIIDKKGIESVLQDLRARGERVR